MTKKKLENLTAKTNNLFAFLHFSEILEIEEITGERLNIKSLHNILSYFYYLSATKKITNLQSNKLINIVLTSHGEVLNV